MKLISAGGNGFIRIILVVVQLNPYDGCDINNYNIYTISYVNE